MRVGVGVTVTVGVGVGVGVAVFVGVGVAGLAVGVGVGVTVGVAVVVGVGVVPLYSSAPISQRLLNGRVSPSMSVVKVAERSVPVSFAALEELRCRLGSVGGLGSEKKAGAPVWAFASCPDVLGTDV